MAEQKIIKKTAEELLKKLGVKGKVEVSSSEPPEVTIETDEEVGILIGFHGESLRSLELILTLLVSSRVGAFTRIILDVGDYRKQHEEKLVVLAQKLKEQVVAQGKPQFFLNLEARDRRFVHLFFQEDKEVTTESQGEGEERQLIIKPR